MTCKFLIKKYLKLDVVHNYIAVLKLKRRPDDVFYSNVKQGFTNRQKQH